MSDINQYTQVGRSSRALKFRKTETKFNHNKATTLDILHPNNFQCQAGDCIDPLTWETRCRQNSFIYLEKEVPCNPLQIRERPIYEIIWNPPTLITDEGIPTSGTLVASVLNVPFGGNLTIELEMPDSWTADPNTIVIPQNQLSGMTTISLAGNIMATNGMQNQTIQGNIGGAARNIDFLTTYVTIPYQINAVEAIAVLQVEVGDQIFTCIGVTGQTTFTVTVNTPPVGYPAQVILIDPPIGWAIDGTVFVPIGETTISGVLRFTPPALTLKAVIGITFGLTGPVNLEPNVTDTPDVTTTIALEVTSLTNYQQSDPLALMVIPQSGGTEAGVQVVWDKFTLDQAAQAVTIFITDFSTTADVTVTPGDQLVRFEGNQVSNSMLGMSVVAKSTLTPAQSTISFGLITGAPFNGSCNVSNNQTFTFDLSYLAVLELYKLTTWSVTVPVVLGPTFIGDQGLTENKLSEVLSPIFNTPPYGSKLILDKEITTNTGDAQEWLLPDKVEIDEGEVGASFFISLIPVAEALSGKATFKLLSDPDSDQPLNYRPPLQIETTLEITYIIYKAIESVIWTGMTHADSPITAVVGYKAGNKSSEVSGLINAHPINNALTLSVTPANETTAVWTQPLEYIYEPSDQFLAVGKNITITSAVAATNGIVPMTFTATDVSNPNPFNYSGHMTNTTFDMYYIVYPVVNNGTWTVTPGTPTNPLIVYVGMITPVNVKLTLNDPVGGLETETLRVVMDEKSGWSMNADGTSGPIEFEFTNDQVWAMVTVYANGNILLVEETASFTVGTVIDAYNVNGPDMKVNLNAAPLTINYTVLQPLTTQYYTPPFTYNPIWTTPGRDDVYNGVDVVGGLDAAPKLNNFISTVTPINIEPGITWTPTEYTFPSEVTPPFITHEFKISATSAAEKNVVKTQEFVMKNVSNPQPLNVPPGTTIPDATLSLDYVIYDTIVSGSFSYYGIPVKMYATEIVSMELTLTLNAPVGGIPANATGDDRYLTVAFGNVTGISENPSGGSAQIIFKLPNGDSSQTITIYLDSNDLQNIPSPVILLCSYVIPNGSNVTDTELKESLNAAPATIPYIIYETVTSGTYTVIPSTVEAVIGTIVPVHSYSQLKCPICPYC